jgi:hypothetical protein
MANAVKGEVEVPLEDGRKLKLVFDANAWCEIEDALGRNTQDIIADLQAKPPRAGVKVQRAIMWGGLRRYHPELSLEDAGDILIEASEALHKAIGSAMPEADAEAGEAEAGPRKPRRGTGAKP